MKSAKVFVLIFAVAGIWAAFCPQSAVADPVAGYIRDTELFPDMLQKKPDCNTAYQDYLVTIHQIQACHDAEEAKENQAIQEAMVKEFSGMKGCGECKKLAAHAKGLAASYAGQAKLYEGKCPEADELSKLKSELVEKEKVVCKSCHKKWPGTLGPKDKTPCD